MKITLNIPASIITNMMISAIESGDPVTNALKGGWCWGIYYKTMETDPPAGDRVWYDNDKLWVSNFQIQIVEVADENIYDRNMTPAQNITSGAFALHTVKRADFVKGLSVMAAKYPRQFRLVMENDTDAPCADIFLQCVLFGEEKYA